MIAMDMRGRSHRLRARVTTEAMIITRRCNIEYLTGFTGSAGLLLVLPDSLLLITDGRYGDHARAQIDAAGVDCDVAVGLTVAAQRDLAVAACTGCRTVGLEADDVSWSRQQAMANHWFSGVELVPTTGVVEGLRVVKDAGEVDRIETAARIADDALSAVRPRLSQRCTEFEFALELDHTMRLLGARGPSFDTIIASGANAAMPHHRPSERVIAEGDLVICDFGALVHGYASDMTRTFVVGEPSATQQEVLDVVTAAQAAGVAAVTSGATAKAVDAACRDLITRAGFGDHFTHGTGHGVGLQIHEDPFIGTTSDAVLAEGNVITVEPGVYIAGLGGVRVEDSVLVTSTGCRPLTHHTKDIRCLPSPPTT